ncbi:hypothetical protein [Oricola indica]|uniref:hypothetical protein n=1 Tax=Oricola indica TaxID=2872591 RepID=UPI001CBAFC6B|nr:hypothetical protein [Oricola indica]
MRYFRAAFGVIGLFALYGCVTETAQFTPLDGQTALVRDGQPAIVSKKPGSILIVQPAKEGFPQGSRPEYVIGLFNPGTEPLAFSVANIRVKQTLETGKPHKLKVFTYEQLVAEERSRQVATAILLGVAAAADSYSASQAGYYNSTSTVYTPRGTAVVSTTGYSSTAAAIAQASATAESNARMDSAIESGRRNLANLRNTILKDHTLLPGEWYGGKLQFEPPKKQSTPQQSYQITVYIGGDAHVFDIKQGDPTK